MVKEWLIKDKTTTLKSVMARETSQYISIGAIPEMAVFESEATVYKFEGNASNILL